MMDGLDEPVPSHGGEPSDGPARLEQRSIPVWVYILVGLIGVFALISFLPFVLLFIFARTHDVDARPFERAKWLDPGWKLTGPFHTVRQEMVDDLLASKLRVGMPINEVHWLVGAPDEKPYFKPGDWTYYLGHERGFISVDNEWLAIDFDELGRVSRVSLETD